MNAKYVPHHEFVLAHSRREARRAGVSAEFEEYRAIIDAGDYQALAALLKRDGLTDKFSDGLKSILKSQGDAR